MDAAWIVLADSHHARIYIQPRRNAPLQLVEELHSEEARLKSRDIVTDRPGVRAGSGTLLSGHSAVGGTSPEETEERRFSHILARRLADGRSKNEYAEMVLVMPPRTFGAVRAELDPRTRDRIVQHIDSDFLHLSVAELKARIDAQTELRPATTAAVRARRASRTSPMLPKTAARRPQDGRIRGVPNAPKGRFR